jgi:hypothetical protein
MLHILGLRDMAYQGRRTSTACFVIIFRLLYGGSALAILGCLLVIMAVLISEKGGDYR